VFRIADELDQRIDKVFLAPLAIPGAGTAQLDGALERLLASEVEADLLTVWTGADELIQAEDVDDFEAALESTFARLRERRRRHRRRQHPRTYPSGNVGRSARTDRGMNAITLIARKEAGELSSAGGAAPGC
jgi:hypothetical protein